MNDIDFRARLFDCLHQIKRNFLHCFYTFVHRLEANAMGIELGKCVSFNGHITLDRFKHSTIRIGDGVTFNSHSAFNPRGCKHCMLKTATDFAKIVIGNNTGMSGVSIVAWDSVEIGNNVLIGSDTCIGDTDGHPDRLNTIPAPIKIGDNVFIGMHSMIMKGVTIGNNVIIGAGSIVSKDIPDNCVAVGIPCRVIRYVR